jgi:hypothetical protein
VADVKFAAICTKILRNDVHSLQKMFHIYIYIYRERERERVCVCVCVVFVTISYVLCSHNLSSVHKQSFEMQYAGDNRTAFKGITHSL